MRSLLGYLRRLFAERRADPRDDLITALMRAEEAGDRLDEDELLGMVFLLLAAGHKTTVNLIGTSVLTLLRRPGECDRLRRDPGLIRPAVDELVRFTSPVEVATERYAREDVTIADVPIRRGEMVLGLIGSANRGRRPLRRTRRGWQICSFRCPCCSPGCRGRAHLRLPRCLPSGLTHKGQGCGAAAQDLHPAPKHARPRIPDSRLLGSNCA